MSKKKIFVYGTLLEGLGNWQWALNRDGAIKLGAHTADGNYTMVSCGGFPAVIPHTNGNTPIKGEVYEVEDNIYNDIERLEGFVAEGHDWNHYDKATVETPWGEADMYVQKEDSLTLPKVESGDWKNY